MPADPSQQTLFSTYVEMTAYIAAFHMLSEGYYFINRERLRVQIDGKRHALFVGEANGWKECAVLIEGETFGLCTYALTGYPSFEHLYAELMGNATKYKIFYGQETHRCSECNHELFDKRSQHYGIGPDCEEKNPYQIQLVDEQFGAAWEEL